MYDLRLWAEAGQWIVLLLLGFMVAGLVYLVADVQRRLGPDRGPLVPNDGLDIGELAPALGGTDARTGEAVRWQDLSGRSIVAAFLSPTCPPCIELAPHLNRLARSRRDIPVTAVVLEGQGVDYRDELDPSIPIILDEGGKLQNEFAVQRTPLVYVIDHDGQVVMKTVSNDLLNLEDALDGIAHPQGSSPWVPGEALTQTSNETASETLPGETGRVDGAGRDEPAKEVWQ